MIDTIKEALGRHVGPPDYDVVTGVTPNQVRALLAVAEAVQAAKPFLQRHHASQISPHEWFSSEIAAIFDALGEDFPDPRPWNATPSELGKAEGVDRQRTFRSDKVGR